jgi:hypothetical protein
MARCRTIAECLAAADAASVNEPPLTKDQADRVAAILAPVLCLSCGEFRSAHAPGCAEGGPVDSREGAEPTRLLPCQLA